MASYSLDEFLGAGVLKDMGSNFAEDGWDDVPTLKIIRADDMDALNLTDIQRVSLAAMLYLFLFFTCTITTSSNAAHFFLSSMQSTLPPLCLDLFPLRWNHILLSSHHPMQVESSVTLKIFTCLDNVNVARMPRIPTKLLLSCSQILETWSGNSLLCSLCRMLLNCEYIFTIVH